MSHEDIIRAWKDADFRSRLSDSEQAALPENPAGLIELTDIDLDAVAGGRPYISSTTCTDYINFCCCSGDFCA